jgi:short subunit dehydrogenase-like uncharacterized protein
MNEREFDLVLFGATGFTGRLVAEYLAQRASERALRWAFAGRDRARLESVKAALNLEVPVLLGDARDESAMRALASRTRVVATTVGPYAKYGSALVAACAGEGTDYCDLTGEVHWMRAMIDAHHERAARSGARIVHACGYDSIPSDLGTLALFEHAERSLGVRLERITHYAGEARGGVSGGTAASALALASQLRSDRSLRRLLADPYALNPEPRPKGPDGPDDFGIRYDDDVQMWTAPFVMAAVNTRVVRRSNALLGDRYGAGFRYVERMSTGAGPKGLARAAAITAGMASLMIAMQSERVRSALVGRVIPQPGEGPSRESIERGYFVSRFVGRVGDRVAARLELRGRRDPGYGATAGMLAESALWLLDDDGPRRGGVLTPASAMGTRLLPALERAGLRFVYA